MGMTRSLAIVLLVMATFFVISFVTNILDPLMPTLRASFGINGFEAGLMAFAFFSAYGIMSIPAGLLTERVGARTVLLTGLATSLLGAVSFALWPGYATAIPSLFVIAIGFAMLQVVINPLLREAGGKEHYALWGNASQLVFGGASFLSPFVYAALVAPGGPSTGLLAHAIPADKPWVALYWLIAVLLIALLVTVALVRIPRDILRDEDRIGSWRAVATLVGNPKLRWYFIGIFCYVGLEQGIALSIAQFLQTYHGIDPAQGGHIAVAWFWGSMLIGCAVGLVLMRLFDTRAVLAVFGIGGFLTLIAALALPGPAAQVALPLMGFWCSIMWPVIFALALNSFARQHGAIAGILCTGIVGGACMPLLIGRLSDVVGLRSALLVLLVPLAYIIGIGIWARPLVRNPLAGRSALDEGDPGRATW